MFVIGAELVQVLQWKDAVIERWVVPQEIHQGSGVMPNGIHRPVVLQSLRKAVQVRIGWEREGLAGLSLGAEFPVLEHSALVTGSKPADQIDTAAFTEFWDSVPHSCQQCIQGESN